MPKVYESHEHCDRPQSGTQTLLDPLEVCYNRFMDLEVFSKS